jgi:ATP-dependent Lhr-like helicase
VAPPDPLDPLAAFGAATCAWFRAQFPQPTPVQERGWAQIAAGRHALLLAPTGSGKTLAAFLSCLDRLAYRGESSDEGGAPAERSGVRLLYVSPLKALVYDVERNLREPLAGIRRAAEELGDSVRDIRVAVRTGDTPARERRRLKTHPAEVLVTTPESLYLILSSQARESLRTVQWVIVDEIHAVAPSKRGVHLALSLERLSELADVDPQRIGLSATQRPLDEVARYLGGDREVAIVDASAPPRMELALEVPVADMDAPTTSEDGSAAGIWSAIHPRLLELIRAHRSTLLFVNSRVLCERLAQSLNELAEEELVKAHHGSLAHEQRSLIEEELKRGELAGLVSTSSLELGIDMGAIDLVLLIESPGAVSRGLQRVGRAGHSVGGVSQARMFPKFKGDLLEAAVVARGMLDGEIESLRAPRRCLDVLAQHVASMVSQEDWPVSEVERVIRRSYAYRDLPRDALVGVLDMLSGRYPSDAFADLRPIVTWDRQADVLRARRGTRTRVVLNPGTIPDRGTYGVHLGSSGPRVGELDEEMVFESRRGETFILGASTWRVVEITRDRVIVEPAPGEPGKLPFWRGSGPGRPVELGRALGRFLRELSAQPVSQARGWLTELLPLDAHAAGNLVDYVQAQQAATTTVPSDRAIVVERFRDELGDWRICILSPFGSRVHAGWALALEAQLAGRAGFSVQTIWSDDGIVLRFANTESLDDLPSLVPRADEVEDLIVGQLVHSPLFAATFRECAVRALLLPRRGFEKRRPLWAQRIKAETLLAAAGQYADFPIVLEAYRECLQDVLDLVALKEILAGIERREIQVVEVETERASPFSRSLSFAYVSAFMYQTDAPLAERRAQALTLDRDLLRELLGTEELRELLCADAIAALESELQGLAEGRRARHADGLADLLRRVGDLSVEELHARCAGSPGEEPAEWISRLEAAQRIVRLHVSGEARYVAVEDAARYREGLGCGLPPGLAQVFLEPVSGALEGLVARYARTHGPFTTGELSARWGIPGVEAQALLEGLVARGRLVSGPMRPGATGVEHCDPQVLRRLRRRTLARLRREVAPVEAPTLCRFLLRWQGVGATGDTPQSAGQLQRLREVVSQLEGVALPFSTLEERILPTRVVGYQPQLLDELGQRGEVVWVGVRPLGSRDGKLALYTRARAPLLLGPIPEFEPPSELHRRLLEHLQTRGASFFLKLQRVAAECDLPAAGLPALPDLLERALLDLAWAGQITNDSFQPLRSSRRPKRGRARGRRPVGVTARGARWVSLGSLTLGADLAPAAAEVSAARAQALLNRYGVISRAVARAEGLPGGFGAVYGQLRRMEELGRARRGHFVAGLEGAQFALPGAVDRLRAAREVADPTATAATLLAATDPANPYGVVLPWPHTADEAPRPRRSASAWVVLAAGRPVLHLEPGTGNLLTFPAAEDEALLSAALAALRDDARARGRDLHLERIDGVPARHGPWAESFARQGFVPDYRGLSLALS